MLYANCIGIQASPNGKSIARVQAATLTGRRFTATAKHYILATGAIENARVLLASGLGNANGLVGRYFVDHVEVPGALLLPSDPDSALAFYRPHEAVDPASTERTSISGVLAMSPELQRGEKLASVASTELERMTLRERTDARFHEGAHGLEFASALADVVSDVDAPSPPPVPGGRKLAATSSASRSSRSRSPTPTVGSRFPTNATPWECSACGSTGRSPTSSAAASDAPMRCSPNLSGNRVPAACASTCPQTRRPGA